VVYAFIIIIQLNGNKEINSIPVKYPAKKINPKAQI